MVKLWWESTHGELFFISSEKWSVSTVSAAQASEDVVLAPKIRPRITVFHSFFTQAQLNELCSLFTFQLFFYRGKSSKNAGNSIHQNFFDDRARTDGTKAIPSRCFNFDSKPLNLFQPLRQLYIFVRFRRFYSHGILTKEHNRFTLSRKPTWISFKRRCCENSSQLSQQSMSETCLRPALRHLFALISMLSIETSFPSSLCAHRTLNFGTKIYRNCTYDIRDHDNPSPWARTDYSIQPVIALQMVSRLFTEDPQTHILYILPSELTLGTTDS